MTLLQQQIKSVFSTLPQKIQDLLLSEDFNERVEQVALHYTLDEIDTGILIRITVRLLAGIIPPTQFVSTIIEEIDIPREKAAFIAQEINRDIFNPLKEELKQIHQIGESAAPAAPAKPLDPLYPSFLEQIKNSTPPYISGSFPSAAPDPQGAVVPQPTQVSAVAKPIVMTNIFETPKQPVSANTPIIIPPPASAPIIPLVATAPVLPLQPPTPLPPTQPLTPAPVQAMSMQNIAPLLSVPAPVPPLATVASVAFVQPPPITTPPIALDVPLVSPTPPIAMPAQTPALQFVALLPKQPEAAPIQPIPPPLPPAPVAPPPLVPVVAAVLPSQPSLAQALPNIAPERPLQSVTNSFQVPMPQTAPVMTPPTPAPIWTTPVTLKPSAQQDQQSAMQPPNFAPPVAQPFPTQSIPPLIPVSVSMPQVATVAPTPFVPPRSFVQMEPQSRASSPTEPLTTSAFEQKMTGAYVVKSDVPDYSAPMPAVVAPAEPVQPAAVYQAPPSNPQAPQQGADAYREPIG